jgi:hypothetical protein
MSLITTISELKKYVSIDPNADIENWQPFINEAQSLYVNDLLSDAFVAELQAEYDDVNGDAEALPTDLKNLFPYLQRTLAYYTILLGIPHLTVTVGDMGIREHNNAESMSASRWKEEKIQLHALTQGDIHADKLLEYLEDKSNLTAYATWVASASNTSRSGLLVSNTRIANQHIRINNSRRLFKKLLPVLETIETRSLPKLVGQQQYDELVDQLKNNTLSANNAKLVAKLQPLVAKRALYENLPYLQVSIGTDGIWLYTEVADLRKKDFLATDSQIKAMRLQLMDGEFGYLSDEQELRQFLLDNIDNYPLVKTTGVYTSRPDPGPTWRTPDPEPNDKYFAV